MSKLAVVLIRGLVGINVDIKTTLQSLKLNKKHVCVIIEDNAVNRGMLKKAQSYITFGEVTEDTIKKIEARKNSSNTYNLAPPKGGFERKGIKQPFNIGGALGYRGEKINDLLVRMA